MMKNLRMLLLNISKHSRGADWQIVKELCEGILAGEDITYVKLP